MSALVEFVTVTPRPSEGIDAKIAELQARPGEWAIVETGKTYRVGRGNAYRDRGCEMRTRRDWDGITWLARWPIGAPTPPTVSVAPAAPRVPSPQSRPRQTRHSRCSTGVRLRRGAVLMALTHIGGEVHCIRCGVPLTVRSWSLSPDRRVVMSRMDCPSCGAAEHLQATLTPIAASPPKRPAVPIDCVHAR